jgi:tetratricopeptide (TPR) repeat protein
MAYGQMSYDPWETPPEERKARFVGREALLERLLSGIVEQEGHKTVQHYLLLGPRGIGKTSILLTVRDRVRETAALSARWFCVQLREEEYFIRTLRDLLELVLRALAEEDDLPDAAEVAERAHQEKREERSLAVAVEGLRSLAARRGRRILLLIDNFDRLFPATAAGRRKTRPAENEFRAFRKLLSKESFLMVVGASVRVFEEIAAYDQAFFNFFTPVEIPNLSESAICELLRKCAELEKNTAFLAQFEAQRDKVRAITYLTGGNPRLVVMLYDVLRQHEMAPVVEALRETVGGLTPLLKHVLDDMPRQQSKTLDALVRLRGVAPPNEIARAARLPLNVVTAQLGRLKEARFVVVEGEGKGRPATYRVSDPMFHTWYQMRYLRPAGRRIELFVEFIRAWFSVEERREFLDEQWRVLGDNGGRGLRGYASQEASLAIRYYAFALEDEGERQEQFGRLADAFVEAGKQREAAMLLAEAAEPAARTERQCESAGYRLLGDRMRRKGRLSDAIAAYRGALTLEPGNVEAIVDLGVSLGLTGEYAQAAAEFQRVIDLPGASAEPVAGALFNRGVTKGSLGDSLGAIADYTAVVDLPGARAEGIAKALAARGWTKGSLGDSPGAIADYSAVVDLPGAPAGQVARALVGRGVAKGSLGDSQGAIADYTAAVDLDGAPAEEVAMARVARGGAFGAEGDPNKMLSDFQSVVDMPGVSQEHRGSAMLLSGMTLTMLNRPTEAVARLEECLGLRASAKSVHGAFARLIRTHLKSGRAEDAARLMARLHEFEPGETAVEKRLEARVEAITNAGQSYGAETAALLLDAALKNDPEDIRVRMEFLAPAIEYARTGDEQALSRLPERERDMAKQIAAVIMGKKDKVEAGH